MKVDTIEKVIIFFRSFTYPQASLDITFKIHSNIKSSIPSYTIESTEKLLKCAAKINKH